MKPEGKKRERERERETERERLRGSMKRSGKVAKGYQTKTYDVSQLINSFESVYINRIMNVDSM